MDPGAGEYAAEQIRRTRGVTLKAATRLLEGALAEGVIEGLEDRYREAWERAKGEGLALRPGERFRRYSIKALLGVGGMGAVYRARDTVKRRTVALKLLRPALAEVHAKGMLHRDVKPGNILLHPGSSRAALRPALPALPLGKREWTMYRAALSDFGLVRPRGGGGRATRTGEVLGTSAYMSPEQSRGRGRDVGPPSDVYSLGMVLCEMLTGDVTPGAVLSAGDAVPADVREILAKALSPKPEARYPNGGEMRGALRRALLARLA